MLVFPHFFGWLGWLMLLFSRIFHRFQLIFVWVKWIPSVAAQGKWNWRVKKTTSYALSPQKCEVYKGCINKSNRFFATFREVKHPRRWWQRELKKVINGLISKTATLHKHAAKFSLQLFLGRHCDYNVKHHSVRFRRGRLNNKNNETLICFLKIQPQQNSPVWPTGRFNEILKEPKCTLF